MSAYEISVKGESLGELQDELFHLFHTIYSMINESRPEKDRIVLLDKEIGEACKRYIRDEEE